MPCSDAQQPMCVCISRTRVVLAAPPPTIADKAGKLTVGHAMAALGSVAPVLTRLDVTLKVGASLWRTIQHLLPK